MTAVLDSSCNASTLASCVESQTNIFFSDLRFAEDIAYSDHPHEDLLSNERKRTTQMALAENLGAFCFNTGFHCLA